MCGISGIIAKEAKRFHSSLEQMIRVQHHRGPDGNGMAEFENCLLGHNRLSIVDLHTGDQPLFNHDRSAAIVFNGEIYGYKDIRASLSYAYRTQSDTEVILAIYEKWGTKMMEYLPGMFSFAIWDEREQFLFAARDRFGEKPFFYAQSQGCFVFASEIKTILASGLVQPVISRKAVSRFLNYGYTGPTETIYENIHVLPPAHYLVVKNGAIQTVRYWNFPPTQQKEQSLGEAAEQFESLFTKAVKKQIIADVEVCAFLSGGLDSTSVVSIAHQVHPGLKTLAFGYAGESSELPFAREAAAFYGTDHHEMLEDNMDVAGLLQQLPAIYDEPFSDSSAIATFQICKKAREFGKVVLTGDGGDELLGGYVWWYRPALIQHHMPRPSLLREWFVYSMAVSEKVKEVSSRRNVSRKYRDQYLHIQSKRKTPTPLGAVQSRFSNLSHQQLQQLELPDHTPFHCSWKEENNMNDAFKFDAADYMPGDILVKTDRAAMANSLELRSPFLDQELASFCLSLPDHLKLNHTSDKIILREALSKNWPPATATRAKQGFGVTNTQWMQKKEFQELYAQYLYNAKSPLFTIIPYAPLIAFLKTNKALQQPFLVLALWADKVFSQTHYKV